MSNDEQATTTESVAKRDEILAELSTILSTAESLEIRTATQYENAAELLQRLKGAMKRSEEERKALVKPYNDEVARINGDFKPVKDRAGQIEGMLKRAIRAYNEEQDRKARELEAKEREKAQRQQERLNERARKAEEKGDTHKAEQLREQAEDTSMPVVAPSTPKVQGLHTREVAKWEYLDRTQIRPEYLVPDEKAIGAVVKSMGKRAEGVVGGIKVWIEEQVVSRAR